MTKTPITWTKDTLSVRDEGYFEIVQNRESEYPGIDIAFIPNKKDSNAISDLRIVFEYPKNGELRLLIWDDPEKEDYTKEITFERRLH